MFILGMLAWWYGVGWRQRASMLRERIGATMDYFSIDLLVRTLFSPFRQISAGKVRGPLAVQMHAFFDRLVSRAIGGMVRLFMIVIGTVAIVSYAIIGCVVLLFWGVVPFLPIIGIVLFMSGWIPWSL